MLMLSIKWLGRQCPTTRWFRGISSDGLRLGKMSRHRFPIGARRPPPSNDRWLSLWFKHHGTSGQMQRLGLSQRFTFRVCPFEPSKLRWLVVGALALVVSTSPSRGGIRKIVLMINEVGQSHPGPVIVTNAIASAMQSESRFEEEFHWENLDAVDISDDSLNELRDSIIQKYRHQKLDNTSAPV
jgi:hypothetical protein